MKQLKKEFTKYNSLALKGIAIIIMLFHHGFRKKGLFDEWKISFFPFNQNIVIDVSDFFKICVSIFVFITGYGLVQSLRKLNDKYEFNGKELTKWIIDRILKFLARLWIIAIIAYVLLQIIDGKVTQTFFSGSRIYGIISMIINFLGLSNLFGTATIDGNWWYNSLAILLIYTIPFILIGFKKYGYIKILIIYVLLPRILNLEYVNSSYISFIFAGMLGIICAENNLLVKWANCDIHVFKKKSKILKFLIELVLLVILYRVYMALPKEKFWEIRYGIIPMCIIFFLYEFVLDIPIIKNILEYFGKHSMNMYLIHGLIRTYCFNFFIRFSNNFLFLTFTWFGVTLIISILLELFKKLIKYDEKINKLQVLVNKGIDKIYEKNKNSYNS